VGGACCTHGTAQKIVQGSGKPEEKRPLGRPRRRWENVMRMDLRGFAGGGGGRGFIWLRIGAGGGLL
jgi:hypothetical protein